MTYKWITILIILNLCSIITYSQINDTDEKIPSISNEQSDNERYVKQQAVFLLKNNLLNAKSIENFRQRTKVIAEASTTLWDYDKSFARESLLDFINQSLADYKDLLSKENRTTEENTVLQNLAFALKKSLKALAGKDLQEARLLQNKYFEIKQQSLKGKDLNESLELAAEGLDFDEQRTLELLSTIIQQGIPNQFPKLIFDLREKNPAIAKILIQKALQNLAVNPNYQTSDAIYLSVVIFNEAGIIMPSLRDATNPNEFGVATSFIGNSNNPTDREIISSYFSSAQNFINLRLQNQASGFFDSKQNLLRSYFLLEKLKSYNQKYGFNNSQTLNSLSIPITTLMQTAEFSQQTLSDIKGYAQRIANSNNPLGLNDGTDLLEKAENAKNPNEKLDYSIRGIIQLIEFKKYAKAERKIFDIENVEIRDSLYLFLNMRAGLEAIDNKNWHEFEKRTEKITEKRIKAFLYLKAIAVFKSDKNNNSLPSEYLIKAEKNIQDISDKVAKASAYIYLTSLLLSLNQTDGIIMLPSAIKSINDSSDYNQDEFEINIRIPTRQTYFAKYIGANSFQDSFSKLAEIDWNDSQIQANQINSKGLQAIAEIASARTVLRKMKSADIEN